MRYPSKTIINLLYYTGIRRQELIDLKTTSVDFETHSIKVLGKRNKERLVPVLPSLHCLKVYLSLKKDLLVVLPDYFFCTSSGIKLSEGFVYKTVNYYFSLVSTKVKKAPICCDTVLRPTF